MKKKGIQTKTDIVFVNHVQCKRFNGKIS